MSDQTQNQNIVSLQNLPFKVEKVERDGFLVSVNQATDKCRVFHDLCFRCQEHDHCLIARQCQTFRLMYHLEFLITACPRYYAREEEGTQ